VILKAKNNNIENVIIMSGWFVFFLENIIVIVKPCDLLTLLAMNGGFPCVSVPWCVYCCGGGVCVCYCSVCGLDTLGMIPRAMDEVIRKVNEISSDSVHYTVRASNIEIYNEQVRVCVCACVCMSISL